MTMNDSNGDDNGSESHKAFLDWFSRVCVILSIAVNVTGVTIGLFGAGAFIMGIFNGVGVTLLIVGIVMRVYLDEYNRGNG